MPTRLRRFVYLDPELTRNFLAQLEGGVYEEESQTTMAGKDRKAGAGAEVGPLKGEMSRSRSGQDTTSRTVKQVADGDFSRLATLLEKDDAVQWLESVDEGIWQQLRRGEVLEIDATVTVPMVFQLGALAGSASPVFEFMRATGSEIDTEAEQAVELASMIGGVFKDPTLLATLAGAPEYTFILPLENHALRVELMDLVGDATVWGTLERKLRGDDQWSMLDALGLASLPNADEVIKGFESDELEGSVVRAPAAVLKPVAIYR